MQYLKEEVRDDILTSALDEFYQKGYQGSSMRNIAKNADMTVGNLYRYFKNKNEIFDFLIEPVIKFIVNIIECHEKKELFKNGDSEAMNTFLAESLMEVHNESPKQLAILIHGSKGSNFEDFKEQFITQLADHIKEHCYMVGGCQGSKALEPIVYRIIAQNDVEGYISILDSDLTVEEKERAIFQYSKLMTSLEFCL